MAVIDKQQGNSLIFTIMPDSEALVGEYKLYVEMRGKGPDGKTAVTRYQHRESFYLIFNPWCKGM